MWVHEEELVDAAAWNATVASRELSRQPTPFRVSFGIRTCLLFTFLLSFAASMHNLIVHGLSSMGVVAGKAGGGETKVGVLSV
mmetsp:Transcript_22049/g.55179  ORF Transcript_22049/g.55179 Transcript_22049/m.55179 type:complete len:83 (+) Transcript_22049:2-250(+)